MRESQRSRHAFERYVRMGDSRSLARLREALAAEGRATSLRTLESWSTALHWQTRIADFERQAAAAADQQLIEALREMNERQAKEGLLLQQKGAARMAELGPGEMEPDTAIRALIEGARLERLARGAATDRPDVRREERDTRLEGFSDAELERLAARLDEELATSAGSGAGDAKPR